MANFLYGSICLSDIPTELIKKLDNGKLYLNVSVQERREVGTYGETHFISCRPKNKEERKEGVNYIIGGLKTYDPQPQTPTVADIDAAPAASPDDLPF